MQRRDCKADVMLVWRRSLRPMVAIIALWAVVFAPAPASAQEPKRVLLVHSFGPSFGPWGTIAGRFREQLIKQSPHAIDLYEVSLQLDRAAPSQTPEAFIGYMNALFVGRNLDLIIAMGTPAGRVLQRHRADVFPATPMLVTGVNTRTLDVSALTPNDAAVPIGFDQAAPIENILKLLPDTAQIAIVIGASPFEKFWAQAYRRALEPLEGRVKFEWLNELSFEETIQRVAALPPNSAIFYAGVRVDALGVPQDENRSLTRLRAAASAPMFSYIDSHFGQGIVGGPMVSVDELAQRTTTAAIRILGGESAGNIKLQPLNLGSPVYDWRELKQWNIDQAALPPGSTVQFRAPTLWDQYRVYILVIAAGIALQGMLLCWLLYEHWRRQVAEVAVSNTMAELEQMNRVAAAGELSASIAHEIKQPLAAIVVGSSAALNWLKAKKPNIDEACASLQQVAEQGLRVGDIITNLSAMFRRDTRESRPIDINRIISDVVALVQVELNKHGVEVITELADELPLVSAREVQLQQVALNLVMNARDAMAEAPSPRELLIRSELNEVGQVELSFEDSGAGISPSDMQNVFKPMFTTKDRGMGMGLSICRSIVEGHGGRIWVTPRDGGGSIFRLTLPPARPALRLSA